ncbi:hypothetical protein [Embleya sp. AB8]|uniref:hypothetical protein n=1 Tax=Embleya sp. AB8 TaxID=3156304 RepID=UPI003C7909DD
MKKQETPKMSEPQAKSVVAEYNRKIIEGIGAPEAKKGPWAESSPCGNVMSGDSTAKHFRMLHMQNVVVPPQNQEAAFQKARTIVEAMGFQTREFSASSTPNGGSGIMRAVKPVDGFSVTLQTTSPAVEIIIMVSSPCLERVAEWESGVTPGPSAGRAS